MLNRKTLSLKPKPMPSTPKPKLKSVLSRSALKKRAFSDCMKTLKTYPLFKQSLPLKIGIHEDILSLHPELCPKILSYVLNSWTHYLWYIKSMAKHSHRHDLNAKQVEEISPEDKQHAMSMIQLSEKEAA